jgi:hypothetical protein
MESTNKNCRLILTCEVDGFIFSPKDCLWDNFLMGEHNGVQEWCITISNPVGKDIEVFAKEGDFVVIQTFVDFDGNIVSRVAITLPWKVATKYIYGYDELLEENVSLESCFVEEVGDDEPSVDDIKRIEDRELNRIIEDANNLSVEALFDDENN